MGTAASGRALIEEHRSMSLGVEEGPGSGRAARSRTTMEVDNRRARTRTDLLVVQPMAVADVELANVEWLQRFVTHLSEYACKPLRH
jgi:hypothetical protein